MMMMHLSSMASLVMILSTLSLASATATAAADSTTKVSKETFLQAMKANEPSIRRQQARQRLSSKLLQNAKPYNNNSNNNNINRKLDNNNYYNYNNNDDQYGNYGFSISNYSLKYASCSSISTFSDDLAQDEDSSTVFYTQQYVVFRLCPSDECSNSNSNRNNNRYGCMNNFGEYMIPLSDWLDIIGEFRQEEMQRYCNYCDACVGGYYQKNENGGDDDDNGGNVNNGNKYYNYNAENRGNKYYNYGAVDDYNGNGNAGDDDGNAAAADDGNAQEEEKDEENNNERRRRKLDEGQNYDCSSTDACTGYGDVCYNNNDQIDWSQFFNCKKIAVNGEALYVGPHCAKDKSTIVLAAFEDQYCQTYVGDKYDLSTISDDLIASDSLEEYYRSDCISCKESDLSFQGTQDDADDNDDISEVCENLYGYAAKCNRYLSSANDNSYQSYQQASNEYAVCSFIESVLQGSYDENGYIYINANEYAFDNKYNTYAEVARRRDVVTAPQAFGLVFFSLILVGLTGYAAYMRNEVNEKFGFIPSATEPLQSRGSDGIKRQDSGIMLCRSQSNLSYQAPVHDGKMV